MGADALIRFRCPYCEAPLSPAPGGLRCENQHQFDQAREGYVNLLPAGRVRGRAPGDSDDMIRARRALFDAGHYRPIARAVADAVASCRPVHVLDAGCGEGTYLAGIEGLDRIGIDVSKPAIKLAARRDTRARFAVASSYRLPFGDDAQFDAIVSVFAPRPFSEFARVLRPNGVVVVASPGPDHLRGLTELIYAQHDEHEQRPHTAADSRTEICYRLTLRQPDIVRLVQMTPYWWKATADQQAEIAARPELTLTIDVVVSTHRYTSEANWADASLDR